MENTPFMKKIGLMLVVALLMGNTATTHTYAKGIAAIVTIGSLARLACKTGPAKNRLTLTTTLEQLTDNVSKGELIAIAKLTGKFVDDVWVGYRGKSDGPKVAGSSINIEGDDVLVTGIQDGEELRFFMKKGQDHYGFTATLVKNVKEFKEMLEVFTKTFKMIDGRDASAWYWAGA